jgi:hypothetical protein
MFEPELMAGEGVRVRAVAVAVVRHDPLDLDRERCEVGDSATKEASAGWRMLIR